MYQNYWELNDKPFANNMAPKFFYYSPEHEEALVRMLFCVTDGKGMMFMTGEAGIGKTYVARLFAAEMRDKGFHVAMVVNPNLDPAMLLQEILYQFGIPAAGGNKVELLHRLQEFLASATAAGGQVILIIDEAQLIANPETLEEIRLLLNLEADERPLLSIFLIGQPELWTRVRGMPQLLQRVGVACQLKPLKAEDTASYIRHRLTVAGARRDIFTDDACAEVQAATRGVIREVNSLCDMALLLASSREAAQVTRDIVRECAAELRGGDDHKILDQLAAKS